MTEFRVLRPQKNAAPTVSFMVGSGNDPQKAQESGCILAGFFSVDSSILLTTLVSSSSAGYPFPWVSLGFLERFGSLRMELEGSTRSLEK